MVMLDPAEGRTATNRGGRSVRDTGRSPFGRFLHLLLVLTAVVVVLLVPVRLWVAEPMRITTGSMSPSLTPGQHVLTWKLDAGRHEWQPGEIVAFERGSQVFVKRVVAVGGDRVGIRDGELFVNGRRVPESYADAARIDSVYFGPVSVPAGSVFVLGDNRRNSDDSRDFGAVPTSDIEGRVVGILWPLSSFRTGSPS
jgi:signal peptidase I